MTAAKKPLTAVQRTVNMPGVVDLREQPHTAMLPELLWRAVVCERVVGSDCDHLRRPGAAGALCGKELSRARTSRRVGAAVCQDCRVIASRERMVLA